MTYFTISLCAGITVFIVLILIFSGNKKSALNKEPEKKYEKPDEWLYSNFFEKLYDSLFSKQDPVVLSKRLGLEYDKYMINCNIIGKNPNFKRECMMRVIGLSSFFLGVLLSILLFNAIPAIVGTILYLCLVSAVTRSVAAAAEQRKVELILGFPRFLDLLLSALESNLPIDIAIVKVVENVPCVLSSELKGSIAEMQIGAKSWQNALEDVAYKYEIDILSDFVLDIITSYNKGVSVTEAVARKCISIKQSSLLRAKERVAKTSTAILIPIVIFKIVPLLAIMLIPIAIQIINGF